MAIDAPDAEIPIRTLRNSSLNPNLGGAPMVVSLGCEKLQPARMLPSDTLPILCARALCCADAGRGASQLRRYGCGDYETGGEAAGAVECAAARDAAGVGPGGGLQCGGSDAFSGVTANPAVGYASDLLVRAGATVMFSEVTEVRDAIHLLTARAANEQVART